MTVYQIFVLAINLCVLASAAPPHKSHSSRSLSSLFSDFLHNASFPFNSTLLGHNHLPHIPSHDPFSYPIPDSDETLTLWDFGSTLSHLDISGLLRNAERDVAFNIEAGTPMKYRMLQYTSPNDKVRLTIHAKSTMTWEVVKTLIEGLRSWFNRWDYVESDFDIGQVGIEGLFGTGTVVGFR